MTINPTLMHTISSSPLLTTGIGLWAAAMLTFVTKDVPEGTVPVVVEN